MFHTSPTRTLLTLLAGLIVILAVAYVLIIWVYQRVPSVAASNGNTAQIPVLAVNAPVPSAGDYVAAQNGFQYLVSYTSGGFAPGSLTVQKGETVRFTNNSSDTIQISAGGAQSPSLSHGQYWEYTFKTTGTVQYKDITGSSTGSVTVQ